MQRKIEKMKKETGETKAALMAIIKKLNWCHYRNKNLEKNIWTMDRSNQIWKENCESCTLKSDKELNVKSENEKLEIKLKK